MNICKANDCENIARGKGLCLKHYTRYKRHGNYNTTLKTPTGEPMKFFKKSLNGDPSSCYIWKYHTNGSGYGVVYHDGDNVLVHRLSLAIKTKEYGHMACHECDNKLCFNPNHLYWGDAETNARDASRVGVFDKRRKLSIDDVMHIRSMVLPAKEYAKLYNISLPAVYKVRNGISYRMSSIIE